MNDCSQNLGPRLRYLNNRITQYMDQQFLALDLTSTQSFILHHLSADAAAAARSGGGKSENHADNGGIRGMIKRLAACIREYKRPTILTPVCMVGEVVCECTIPLLTADLINAIQNGCTMQTILSFGLKLFVIAMLSLGFGSLSGLSLIHI